MNSLSTLVFLAAGVMALSTTGDGAGSNEGLNFSCAMEGVHLWGPESEFSRTANVTDWHYRGELLQSYYQKNRTLGASNLGPTEGILRKISKRYVIVLLKR